jgi:hypothetical protein
MNGPGPDTKSHNKKGYTPIAKRRTTYGPLPKYGVKRQQTVDNRKQASDNRDQISDADLCLGFGGKGRGGLQNCRRIWKRRTYSPKIESVRQFGAGWEACRRVLFQKLPRSVRSPKPMTLAYLAFFGIREATEGAFLGRLHLGRGD